MTGVLADIAGGERQIICELMLQGYIPLLDNRGLENIGPDADAAARRAASRCQRGAECGESVGNLLADHAVVVGQEEVVDVRRIHRQAPVGAGGFQVIQHAPGGAQNGPSVQPAGGPGQPDPRLETLLVAVVQAPGCFRRVRRTTASRW